MSYTIKYSSKDQFCDMATRKMKTWSQQLDNVRFRLNMMTHLSGFQGDAANSMRNYFASVHEPLLMFLQSSIDQFYSELSQYSDGYYEIDEHRNAVLPEDAFDQVKCLLKKNYAEFLEEDSAIRNILNTVDDIVSVSAPHTGEMRDVTQQVSLHISQLDDSIQNYENIWCSRADDTLADTMHTLSSVMNSYITPAAGLIDGLFAVTPLLVVGRREPFVLMMTTMLQKMKATTRALMRKAIQLQLRSILSIHDWNQFRLIMPCYGPAGYLSYILRYETRPFWFDASFLEEMENLLSGMEETSGNLAAMADQAANGEFLSPESPLVAWIKPFLPMIIFYLLYNSHNILTLEPALLVALVGASVGSIDPQNTGEGNDSASPVTSWSDAVLKGSIAGEGKFLGINTAGELKGELLGASAGYDAVGELSIKFDENGKLDKDSTEVKIGISGNAEGHFAKGEASGNIGYLNGSAEGTFLTGGVKGEAGLTLFDDGKFTPSIGVEVGAEGSVLEGEAEVYFGSDDNNIHGEAEGALLTANAGAEAGAGRIKIEDDSGNEQVVWGAKAEAKAEAYLAEGSVSGGISILGIDIDLELEGKAGGAGAGAGGYITSEGVCGEIDFGLALGAGVKIEIDWSGFELKWPWE